MDCVLDIRIRIYFYTYLITSALETSGIPTQILKLKHFDALIKTEKTHEMVP